MEVKFNPKTLIVARETRSLTQEELAIKINEPQSKLSKIENGNQRIDDEFLKKISDALNYPIGFFEQDMQIYPPNLHYRKKADVPAKTLAYAEAIMNIHRVNVEKLLRSIEIPFTKLPFFDGRTKSSQDAARALRQYWQIPRGPIDNLTKLLEDKGIIVIVMDFGTEDIDGRSMITASGKFIIFINKRLTGDRQRLTLSHELGHIVCHLYSADVFDVDTEAEAKLFASEFLMPENEIKPQLVGYKLTMQKLADLKRYWKTSMQAILYWAEWIKVITKNQARYLWAQFVSLRIKMVEPLPIPPERPTLISEILNAFFDQLKYTREELAEILHLSPSDFTEWYLAQEPQLRIVRV